MSDSKDNTQTAGSALIPLPDPSPVLKEMLDIYPPKVARKRAKHIRVNDPHDVPEVEANVRTIPGIITQRGCCYAGCKGVVIGPIKDLVQIVHGPIGCSYYAWGTRRNLANQDPSVESYMPYCFSTDLTEDEIIFGGEKKLRAAIQEAYELFHPKAIAVFSTCPVGLIGDDVHAVARQAKADLGINVFGFSCEGYKGVSQSAGHHIANNGVFKNMVGIKEPETPFTNPFRINVLGEYNIGGDAWEIERVLTRCGIEVVATFSGNALYDQIGQSHHANLNVVMCHRSINYMAEMMETKFGIPWIKVNFIGADSMSKSLRKIAQYFDDAGLSERVEAVIAEELSALKAVREDVTRRCSGKLALCYAGGSRSHHWRELFKDIEMRLVSAGYEFAHRDDYEGSRVASSIKVDADSRNIEELAVEADPERYRPRKTQEQVAVLEENGLKLATYDGMMPDMEANAIVIDDISHHEMEKMIEFYKPDIFCSGIKDKFVIEKMGVPCKQIHSYDYGGPYAGYKGAANFYRDIDTMINSSARRFLKAPWESQPELQANFAVRPEKKKG
ncbi:MAG: nitrogenase molybdenum-iron protein alpha chain [Capsulimonadaceae bacterium]|nr:nitrogenase molybdenum-iron protein alpha chain [Capsulimonadaceae bacterium]